MECKEKQGDDEDKKEGDQNNEGVYEVVTQTNTEKDQTGTQDVVRKSLAKWRPSLRRNLQSVEEL